MQSTKPGLRQDWLNDLRMSRVMQKKIQGILSDVTAMANAADNTVVAFEYVLLSYAAATGKGKQFCKRVQDSNVIPKDVKSYIYRFFEYEEE